MAKPEAPANGLSDSDRLQRRADLVARGGARAAVLGANDGLISNLSLILGVAGANATQGSVRLAGFASLVAGALSMAAGEWVSVRAQVDLYGGVLAELHTLVATSPALVLDRLSTKLEDIGMDTDTAKRAATEIPLDEDSFFAFTARTVFGINSDELGNPVTAALSSLLLFAVGALVPDVLLSLLERVSAQAERAHAIAVITTPKRPGRPGLNEHCTVEWASFSMAGIVHSLATMAGTAHRPLESAVPKWRTATPGSRSHRTQDRLVDFWPK